MRKRLRSASAAFVIAAVVAAIGLDAAFMPAVSAAPSWPQWRGPAFNGSTEAADLPDALDPATTIVWTTPLPGAGAATPIIDGGRVFVSAGDRATGELVALALDAGTGALLWRRPVGTDRRAMGNNTMASPSPVTDGRAVYFYYGTGALAAFDREGKELWTRELAKDHGEFVLKYGYSSSPLLLDGTLYIAVLQNKQPDRYGPSDRAGPLDSFLIGVDAATGKERWKRVREAPASDESTESYVTPIPFAHQGSTVIVLVGAESVTGHDPRTGVERWRWYFTPRDNMPFQRLIPSAVPGDGLLYAVRPKGRPVYALKPGDGSDMTVAWTFDGPTSDSATPLLYRGRLYVLESDRKLMTCLDATSGAITWQERLGGGAPWRASPTGADGKIFLLSESGEAAVLAAGDSYRVLYRGSLGGTPTRSSIAVAGERVYVRTAEKLYCFGKKAR